MIRRVGDEACGSSVKRQHGFTLIEILVTLAVTTFALLGLMSTIRVSSKASKDSARANEAIGLAEGMAEIIRGMSVSQFETTPWAHQLDARLPNEPASNCDHTGLPYGPINNATFSGTAQSWVAGGNGGGCDDINWKEWHEGAVRGATGVEFRRGVRYALIDAELVWIQVVVEWTNDGALAGSANGRYDRSVTIELVRSRLELPR